MNFIEDGVVEAGGFEQSKSGGAAEFLNGGDDEVTGEVILVAEIPRDGGWREFGIEEAGDGCFGLGQNLAAVGDDENSGAALLLASDLADIECCEPRFAHACGDRSESASAARLTQLHKACQSPFLPRPRPQLHSVA
jgi:hypothetical protein